jgi:tetratricopeptide (TPR) repeat protein
MSHPSAVATNKVDEHAKPEPASDRIRTWLPVVVVVVTLLVFARAMQNGFVAWDDETNLINNVAYRGLGPRQLHWMWTTTLMGHYVPLSWMTLGADYLVWGMNPAGYHLTSVLLHAISAFLLYWVALRLLRLGGGPTLADSPTVCALAAACAALLFSLHPLRVESVAWATERRDVLSCLFFLASILAYLRWTDRPRERTPYARYVASIVFFVASVLSKATSMTLPAVLLVLNVFPLRRLGRASTDARFNNARVLAELVPFAIVSAVVAAESLFVLHPPAQLSLADKFAVSAYSLVFYLWKSFVPTGLSPLYQMPLAVRATEPRFLVYYALIVLAAAALWNWRRSHPAFVTAIVLFVVTSLPMLGFVQNGPQIAADRYTYYSAPALSIAAAGWLFSVRLLSRRAALAIAGVTLVTLSALTWKQIGVWHDSTALWSRVLREDDSSSFGHVGLARLAFDRGDLDSAIFHYRRSVEVNPTYIEGYNNLGNSLARAGRIDEAIAQYNKAIAANPAFAEAYNDLGSVYARQGKTTDAIAEFHEALRIKPAYAGAHNNLGAALAQTGDVKSAIDEYQRALAADSTYVDARVNLGNALSRLGQPAAAEQEYRLAEQLRPDDADLQRNWGVVLAQQGKYPEAVAHFRRALVLRPGDAEISRYLDAALRAR